MNKDSHIIHKVNLEIEFNGTTETHELASRVRDIFYKEILPRIEELLDQLDNQPNAQQSIQVINKMDLDFGNLDLKLDNGRLAQVVWNRINPILEEQLKRSEKESTFLKSGNNSSDLEIESLENNSVISPQRSVINLFTSFLLDGQLRWHPSIKSIKESGEQLLSFCREAEPGKKADMATFLLNEPRAIQRLVRQFDEGFLLDFREIVMDANSKDYQTFISWFGEFKASNLKVFASVPERKLQLLFWETLIISDLGQAVPVGANSFSSEALSSQFKARLIREFPILIKELKDTDDPELKQAKHLEIEKEVLKTERGQASNPYSEKEIEGVFIENAGLVLLHPFFKPYLADFDLFEDNQFKDEVAKEKAIHLLQYLVSGEEGHPENELLLNKVIVGMDPDTVIDSQILLSEDEKNEADRLLKAAIGNWSALGTTTTEGLREGFLKRTGKLSRQEGDWLLQVEHLGRDILLDYLPWNLSIIKLPWLTNFIKVEWTA